MNNQILKKIVKKSASIPLFMRNIQNCGEVSKVGKVINPKFKYLSYKSLISFLIIFLFSDVYSDNRSIFLDYCKNTNQAELCIVSNELDNAISYYDAAFSLVEKPLAKDIHNAIICAKNIKNLEKCKGFTKLMIEVKALNPKYYNKHGLKKYLSSKDKKKIKEKYKEKLKNEDYKFFIRLRKDDQAIRKNKNYNYHRAKINTVDSLNYIKYSDFVNANYFPGEDLMVNYPYGLREDDVMIRHWFQKRYDVDDLILNAVENLHILNYNFGDLYDLKKGTIFYHSKYGTTLYVQYKDKRKLVSRSDEEIEEINKSRAEIGLDTYQNYIKKIDFFEKNKEYSYLEGYHVFIISGSAGEDAYNSIK